MRPTSPQGERMQIVGASPSLQEPAHQTLLILHSELDQWNTFAKTEDLGCFIYRDIYLYIYIYTYKTE